MSIGRGLRDYERVLPSEFLTNHIRPFLSADAQFYVLCWSCGQESRLNPALCLGDLGAFVRRPCRACGEADLHGVRHLFRLEGACAECGAWFEERAAPFEQTRCRSCSSSRLALMSGDVPDYPATCVELIRPKEEPWGSSADDDVRALAGESSLTAGLPEAPLYLIPLVLFCRRLHEHGGYSHDEGAVATLLNTEGLLLRSFFRAAGDLSAGIDSVLTFEASVEKTHRPRDRALREHNVAMAVYSLLARHPEDLVESLLRRSAARDDAIAAAERALAHFDSSPTDDEYARLKAAEIHHVLGDLNAVPPTRPDRLARAVDHYDDALARAGPDWPRQAGVREARARAMLWTGEAARETLREYRANLEAQIANFEQSSVPRNVREHIAVLLNLSAVDERLDDMDAAKSSCKRAAALAQAELDFVEDDESIAQRAESYVHAFHRLARIDVALNDATGALDAVETVRSVTVRSRTRTQAETAARGSAAKDLLAERIRDVLSGRPMARTPSALSLASASSRLQQAEATPLSDDGAFVSLVVDNDIATALVVRVGAVPPVEGLQWHLRENPLTPLFPDPELRPGVFRERRLSRLVTLGYAAFAEPLVPMLQKAGVLRLAVSAPGILARVPFEALRSPNGRELLDDFQVTYLPSLLTGIDLARRARGWQTGDVLLIGYRDNDLPHVGRERESLRQIWGNRVTVLESDRCAKQDVLEALKRDYAYIHFTCHGTFDPLRPLESALLLSANAASDRYRVTANDLLQTQFGGTPVVTLSACSSGLTSYGQAHDCSGLTGSLLRAGARAIIGCRWPVYDDAAATFMTRFHSEARHLADPRRAFEVAQDNYRREASLEDWAAFGYLGV